MSLIAVENLTFSYDNGYEPIFKDVSFQLDSNWKLGFIGRNGRGKTTFLQLLLGKYEYSGKISASIRFAYFPYAVKDTSLPTAEVVEAIHPQVLQWELLRELSLLDMEEEVLTRPFVSLSAGEQTKVLLAALFLKENAFLLIDEPTNHLDQKGRALVSRYLNRKKGFILVSHDRAFLDGCIDHILSINKANIEIQRGNFSSWFQNKAQQDHFVEAENERLKKEAKRLREVARERTEWGNQVERRKYRRNRDASEVKVDRGYVGHKAAKMMQQKKALETRSQAAIEAKEQLLQNSEQADALKLTPLSYHKSRLVSLEQVSIAYGEKTVCSNLSFHIEQGDRIALLGKNGAGKSSLIKLLAGESIPFCGTMEKASSLQISYISQDTSLLSGTLAEYAAQKGLSESLLKTNLHKLDFSRAQFEKDMRDFSSGQKKKVLLAQSLCEQAHLYLWDEPLNYIDVLSRMQIEALLLEYQPTLVFVEHDRLFCEHIATKQISL